MASDQRKLRLSVTPDQYETWSTTAASQGLSVQDFIRRAVDEFNPETNVILNDLIQAVDNAQDRIAEFHLLVMGIQNAVDVGEGEGNQL